MPKILSFTSDRNNEGRDARPASFRTDTQYRAAKRNLIWTSLAAIFFSISRPTEKLYEFSFTVAGVGGSFSRPLVAAFFLVAIIYLAARLFFETRRIHITLNSESAVEAHFFENHSSNEYSSDSVNGSISDRLNLTKALIDQTFNDINEKFSRFSEIEIKYGEIEMLKANVDQFLQTRHEYISNLGFAIRSLEKFQDNPLLFYPTEQEFSQIRVIKNLLDMSYNYFTGILDSQWFLDVRNFDKRKHHSEVEALTASIRSATTSLEMSASKIEILKNEFDSLLQKHSNLSDSIRKEEVFLHKFSDIFVPFLLFTIGAFGCLIWIIAFLSS